MAEKILFVDDEPNILHSIQRQLRNRFALRTAESGDAALRILDTEGPFAVIVSDMRMPGMNGVELLSRVKDRYPETVRLMLTGNNDQETAMEAVNNGQIFRFLTKPCPQATFITALSLALRQHRLIIAEKELLQKTLKGSVAVLAELLAITNPLSFSAGSRCKEYVVGIVKELRLPNPWQYEVAALISQIGCVALPADILQKVSQDQVLTPEEQAMYDGHPAIGASLLEKIPRLEKVTRMIRLQLKRFEDYTDEETGAEFEEVLLGGQVLKAALDFDRLLFRGLGRQEAVATMKSRRNVYNPSILAILEKLRIGRLETHELTLPVDQIGIGMVVAEDIMAKNGVLIIPKGQVITMPLMQGLRNFSHQVGVIEPLKVLIGPPMEDDPGKEWVS